MEIIVKSDCPYYKCSKAEEHVCSMCFCPFYACRIEATGGRWFTTSQGFKVWDCTNCSIAHEKSIVEMLNLDINETNEAKINKAKAKLRYWLTLKKLDED